MSIMKLGYSDSSSPGDWTEFAAVDGKMEVSATNKEYLIREGAVTGYDYVSIPAVNPSAATGERELSKLGTAGFGNWPTSEVGVVAVSTSANDVAAGTGAWTVYVGGLSAAGSAVNATITITGATPTAATSTLFFRINYAYVVTGGTGLTNAGDITLSIGGVDIVAIEAGRSTLESGRYTVGAAKTGYFENAHMSAINSKESVVRMYTRDVATPNSPFVLLKTLASKDGSDNPDGKLPPIAANTDIVFTVDVDTAGGLIHAGLEGWIE